LREAPIKSPTFQAGFDLTDISISKWQKLLKELKIADGVITEVPSENSDTPSRHWIWQGSDGFIVTWCNPITGEHLAPNMTELRPGELSYVGIEGTRKFVKKVFKFIKRNASLIKNECYGERRYL
jgi:hypothetical protein